MLINAVTSCEVVAKFHKAEDHAGEQVHTHGAFLAAA
jgi:hypothetical protein